MIGPNSIGSALAFIVSALFVFSLSACMMGKPSVKLLEESEEDEYIGTVTNAFEDDGCPWLIRYNNGAEEAYLIPVQLDDQFKKNGLAVEFRFHYSRIAQGECQMGQPAVLEEIKPK